MSQVIALIPARSGSKGVIGKNFRELGGRPLWQHAAYCAHQFLREDHLTGAVVLSTDAEWVDTPGLFRHRTEEGPFQLLRCAISPIYLRRPTKLAQDDSSMFAVVQHALTQIPGDDDDILVILQPTAPFRTTDHIRKALALLQDTKAHSVVSVVPLPLTHSPEFQCIINSGLIVRSEAGWLQPYPVYEGYEDTRTRFSEQPRCRQAVEQTYIRDGTVYALRRRTVTRHRDLYGDKVQPLVIDPADSCELDTELQWADLQRRWQERHAAPAGS